jgi:hypothetical protein
VILNRRADLWPVASETSRNYGLSLALAVKKLWIALHTPKKGEIEALFTRRDASGRARRRHFCRSDDENAMNKRLS